VKTKFWQDDKIQKLSFTARYLFLYLITSPYARLTNYYELNNSYLKLETGMNDEQIKKSKEELEKFGLAYFYEGWVFIPNMDKHNRYSVGKLTGKGYQKELESIPKLILDYFNNKKDTSIIGVSYSYDTPRNKKSEIINNNRDREIIREKEKDKKEDNINNEKDEIIQYFNQVMSKHFKTLPETNFQYWRSIYSIEEIKRAIDFIPTHDFWRDKMDLTILFRRKNPKGEPVDYIGQLLNTKKPTQQPQEGLNSFLDRIDKWRKLQVDKKV
jgi:hypothetical protein